MNRKLKVLGKASLKKISRAAQRFGFDVFPRHFYSQIPDFRELAESDHWRKPGSMVGVAGTDLDEQISFAAGCCTSEVRQRLGRLDLVSYATNENGEIGYGPAEADFLYCFIAAKRPGKIVQIGAGFSTAVILKSAADGGFGSNLVCVDPFPTDYLKRIGSEGKIQLIAAAAQRVELDVLTSLGEGDLLFVDSTHTVRPDSEVNRIVLEVLPRLKAGTYVHFHDIYFPYDYSRGLMEEPLPPTLESTLVHAFLIGNSRFTIRASLSMLHYGRQPRLRELLPHYAPAPDDQGLRIPGRPGHFPSATWLQVV